MTDWWDKAKEIFNIDDKDIDRVLGVTPITKIRKELDELFEKRKELDRSELLRKFPRVAVSKIAYDAVQEEKNRYQNNTMFASSYMILNGLRDEKIINLYKETYKIHKVNGIIRSVLYHLDRDGVIVVDGKYAKENLKRDLKLGKVELRIYEPVVVFVSNIASHLEIDVSYLIGLLILAGSNENVYREIFEKEIEWLCKNQIIRYHSNIGLAKGIVLAYGSKAVKEFSSKVLEIDVEDEKVDVWWRIRKSAKEIIDTIAKKLKIRQGELISRWAYDHVWMCYDFDNNRKENDVNEDVDDVVN